MRLACTASDTAGRCCRLEGGRGKSADDAARATIYGRLRQPEQAIGGDRAGAVCQGAGAGGFRRRAPGARDHGHARLPGEPEQNRCRAGRGTIRDSSREPALQLFPHPLRAPGDRHASRSHLDYDPERLGRCLGLHRGADRETGGRHRRSHQESRPRAVELRDHPGILRCSPALAGRPAVGPQLCGAGGSRCASAAHRIPRRQTPRRGLRICLPQQQPVILQVPR